MATQPIPKKNEEEVDLGSLFLIIGKGISNFFTFLGSIFKGIFHAIVTALIFIKSNLIKIGIATGIGLIVGVLLEVNEGKRFGSDLLVSPNFKSASQLYNNIHFYNDLVRQKDTATIQKVFNIDKQTAASLKKFSITPIVDKNDIINAYNDFVLEVDTTTVKSYSFEDFEASFKVTDYNVHKIQVISEKNDVFSKLQEPILNAVIQNKYFNKVKELTNENLDRTDALLRANLMQIDSLRLVYMKVLLEEAKKQTSGTSIDLGGTKRTTKELELFETSTKLNTKLEDAVSEKSKKYEVVNIISSFQPIGYEIKGISQNKGVIYAFFGFIGMVTLLLLIQLNTFLNNYKK
ncbi:hypothetical protein [Polaribacter tangerinus]|uniref:hypothetical protein n=1 Tax=Polaribacter tangerinus TaxID=1920034 RepID=UPI000B4A5EFE|nr:hypothetical protein [Polaribacter tangerinus]